MSFRNFSNYLGKATFVFDLGTYSGIVQKHLEKENTVHPNEIVPLLTMW